MIDIAKILEILKDAFSALDDALGDSDFPVETDEEEREDFPVQYAARRVSEVMQILEPARDAQQRNAPVSAAIELLRELKYINESRAPIIRKGLWEDVDAVLKTAAGG